MTEPLSAKDKQHFGGSLVGMFLLLAWDAAISGSFLVSLLVCPVWFVVSLAKGVIRRPGWKVGLSRLVVPTLTLGLVLGNAHLQSMMATINAERIIRACEQFRVASERYPTRLQELVPGYIGSVPRAKYSLAFGEFRYWSHEGRHRLMWVVVPPFGRKIYDFEHRQWGFLD